MVSRKKISWANYHKVWITALGTLGACVFVTSLGVIYLKNNSRQILAELQRVDKQEQAIKVEWSQLLLEQGAWSTDARIDRIARESLNMVVPNPKQTVMVKET